MSNNFHYKMNKLKQTIAERDAKNSENVDTNKLSHTCSNVQIRIDEP